MKYRVESIIWSDGRWNHITEYTDNRNVAARLSQWAAMFLPHYGIVIDTDTGAIEYTFGAANRDWIKQALGKFFESLPA